MSLDEGIVICTKGIHKGRIAYCDGVDFASCNECSEKCCFPACRMEIDDCEECKLFAQTHGKCIESAMIYWCEPTLCLDSGFYVLPADNFTSKVSLHDIVNRYNTLKNLLWHAEDKDDKLEYFQELVLVQGLMYERHIKARFMNKKGLRLFISHSSRDKAIANLIYADLVELGHNPWLDQWDIQVGQSIPGEIQKGLEECDYVLVLMSPDSVASTWVSAEWQTIFWDEVNMSKNKVLPLLIKDCEIPTFLKVKKYADFRTNYDDGLEQIISVLDS